MGLVQCSISALPLPSWTQPRKHPFGQGTREKEEEKKGTTTDYTTVCWDIIFDVYLLMYYLQIPEVQELLPPFIDMETIYMRK